MLKHHSRAFTLIELAIVLVIVGLLLTGGIKMLSSSTDVAKYKETENELTEVKEALIDYYLNTGSLPCPAETKDGIEQTEVDANEEKTCTVLRGYLPYITLGLSGKGDAWGQPLKYVVNPKFTTAVPTPRHDDPRSETASLPLNERPKVALLCIREEATGITAEGRLNPDKGLRVFASANEGDRIKIKNSSTDDLLAENPAFALFSTGKNGAQTNAGMEGAFSGDGGCATASDEEKENCNDDSILRAGTPLTDASSVRFDDVVYWVSDMHMLGLLQRSRHCDVNVAQGPSGGLDLNDPNIEEQNPDSGCNLNVTGLFQLLGGLLCVVGELLRDVLIAVGELLKAALGALGKLLGSVFGLLFSFIANLFK